MSEGLLLNFNLLLRKKKYDEAKALFDHTNVKVEARAENVVWQICDAAPDDDPELLMHFVKMGAPLLLNEQGGDTCLSSATIRGKHKTVRALLDLGVPANERNCCGNNTLQSLSVRGVKFEKTARAVMHILDAGGIITPTNNHWICKLHDNRRAVQLQVTIILGLQHCGSIVIACNGKDALSVIGRVVWSNRFVLDDEDKK